LHYHLSITNFVKFAMVNGSLARPPPSLSIMANQTVFRDATLPPLPSYSLEPMPDMLPWISDFWVSLVLPIVVYWAVSMSFHLIDVLDLFPQYRLHTPEEITSRNHVSRYDVARDVIIQQIIQVITGAVLAITEPPAMTGKAEYDVAVWATRIRLSQRVLPGLLGLVGLNASAISKNMATSYPFLAGALAGGYYPFLSTDTASPSFAAWELAAAKFVYYLLIPGLQFFGAVCMLDTWQYFLHRLMHVNRWMYSEFSTIFAHQIHVELATDNWQ
jgi:sphinganine C4-monooxygenase